MSRCWPAWGRGYAFMQAIVDPASHDCTLVFSNAAHSTRFLMTARAHAITCRADLITDEPSNALLRFHGVLCALKKSGFRPFQRLPLFSAKSLPFELVPSRNLKFTSFSMAPCRIDKVVTTTNRILRIARDRKRPCETFARVQLALPSNLSTPAARSGQYQGTRHHTSAACAI